MLDRFNDVSLRGATRLFDRRELTIARVTSNFMRLGHGSFLSGFAIQGKSCYHNARLLLKVFCLCYIAVSQWSRSRLLFALVEQFCRGAFLVGPKSTISSTRLKEVD